MAIRKIQKISKPSLQRLPSYLHLLRDLQATGVTWVSCTVIAEKLNKDPTQVRKDIALTGIAGRPKVGYNLDELIRAILAYLNWDRPTDTFLIGAGNMGRALLGYSGFGEHGLNIVAAFDADSRVVGTTIHGRQVLPLSRFKPMAKEMKITIGIITVPAAGAQGAADLMVDSGIQAIWNFAPARLRVPEHIVVENEDLSGSLAVLCRRLSRRSFPKK
jgi:redox-sensing transcriptional repressor